MILRLKSPILALYAALAALCCAPLAAQNYTFEPVTCGENLFSYGMNGSGEVVGTTTVNGIGAGAIYYNGKCETYPSVYFYGLSDTGWLIGYPPNSPNDTFYLIQPGRVTPLPNPFGLTGNFTYCCIDSGTGTLAGNYSAPGEDFVGFVSQNGKFTSLPWGDTSGATYEYTIAAMNNTNIVVGTYQGDYTLGFVLAKGKITLLAYPKADYTYFYGINDAGMVVGEFYNAAGNNTFTYNLATNTWTNLNFPYPYNSMNPMGITNAGVIALTGAGGSGLVLATPTTSGN